ncbi:MAG: GGDEF domain-containing protein [Methylobacillus sp.]|nr:GGDEF domain-containing protein [Methylobacillus sp.]
MSEYDQDFFREAQRLLGENAQRVLNDILRHAEEVEQQARTYGASLERHSTHLPDAASVDALFNVLSHLRADTRQMHSAVVDLQGNLAHSREEIESLKRELEYARVEALIDPLTGVLNRRGFEMRFARMLTESGDSGGAISLIMLDIDHFKKINDTHGHLFGDKVIRTVAEALRACVKGSDVVTRLGGEEFCVLLPETSLAGARALAHNIRARVARERIRRYDGVDEVGGITISLGVAELNPCEDTAAFLHRADQALYCAKESGRNRVSIAA